MSHYFFDVHDGIEVIDDVGRDLPDIGAAKAEALRIAKEFTDKPGMLGGTGGAVVVVIRDRPGSVVLSVRLIFSIEVS